MEISYAHKLLDAAYTKLDALIGERARLTHEGVRGPRGQAYYQSLSSVLHELRSVRNQINIVTLQIANLRECKHPAPSEDSGREIVAIANELGILAQIDIGQQDPALIAILGRVETAHQQFVELQFEGRRAYGITVCANPAPIRPATLNQAIDLLERLVQKLCKARLDIELIRRGELPEMPSWLEVHMH